MTIFDRRGGIIYNYSTNTTEVFGEHYSCAEWACVDNCVKEKLPDWVIDETIGLLSKTMKLSWDTFWSSFHCTTWRILPQGADKKDAKYECLKDIGEFVADVKNIPVFSEALDIGVCIEECRTYSEMHPGSGYFMCTPGTTKVRCEGSWRQSFRYKTTYNCTDKCNFQLIEKEDCWEGYEYGFWAPWCNPYAEPPHCVAKKNMRPNTDKHTSVILVARDPNIKYGPEGYVSPDQELDYKVEYENEGEGIAFGVYFTDTLDEDLDDSTLEIGPVIDVRTGQQIGELGTYNSQTRTMTWFVGEVGPREGGYANFSINVRENAPDGTEIINFATVHFPSVPETTRTNGIVSIVRLTRPTYLTYNGNLSVQYSDSVNLKALLTTDSGEGVPNKTITFTLGNQSIGAVTDNNGIATTTLTLNQIPEDYTIKTEFAGDDYYLASDDSDNFTIEKEDSILTYNGNLSGQYSDSVTLKAQLSEPDNESGDLSGKNIQFTIGNQTTTAVTDANGIVSITLTLNQTPGDYTVETDFAGDEYYLASNDSDPFEILKEDTILSTPNGQIVYSDNATIQVTLYDDDDQALFHQEDYPKVVYLEYFNGTDWKVISRDTNALNLYFEIPSDLDEPAGNYDLRARFRGDPYYNPTISENGTLTILKEDTVLSDPSTTVVYSDNATVRVTMLDNDREEILHQIDEPKTIYLEYANGAEWKILAQEVLSEGEVTFDFSMPENLDEPAGDYSLRVRFDGDFRYNPTETLGVLTILKEAIVITVPDREGFTFDNVTLEADVRDDDGELLLHGSYEVSFMVGNQSIGNAIIDETGHVEINWNINFIPENLTEIYPIIVNFAGSEYYKEVASQAEFALKSARWLKRNATEELETIDTTNEHSQHNIDKAIEALTDSLSPSLWTDASRLDPKHGHKVFDEQKKAVKELLKITSEKGKHADSVIKDEIEVVIDKITKADELLAKISICDAKNTPVSDPKFQEKVDKEIEKAEEELTKAYLELADDKSDKAIDHFKKAWKHAQLAIKFARKETGIEKENNRHLAKGKK